MSPASSRSQNADDVPKLFVSERGPPCPVAIAVRHAAIAGALHQHQLSPLTGSVALADLRPGLRPIAGNRSWCRAAGRKTDADHGCLSFHGAFNRPEKVEGHRVTPFCERHRATCPACRERRDSNSGRTELSRTPSIDLERCAYWLPTLTPTCCS